MGLDIDFVKIPKVAVVESNILEDTVVRNGKEYSIQLIEFNFLLDHPEKDELIYYRKWNDVRNTMSELFDFRGQCDNYILTKEDVLQLLDSVQNSTEWLLESERLGFIKDIQEKLVNFPFETHYLVYSWIS